MLNADTPTAGMVMHGWTKGTWSNAGEVIEQVHVLNTADNYKK
jgi:hypothetical protein